MPNKNVLIICPDQKGFEAWISELKTDLSPFQVTTEQAFVKSQHIAYGSRPDAVVVIDSEPNGFTLSETLTAIKETCPQAFLALMSSKQARVGSRFDLTKNNIHSVVAAVHKSLQQS